LGKIVAKISYHDSVLLVGVFSEFQSEYDRFNKFYQTFREQKQTPGLKFRASPERTMSIIEVLFRKPTLAEQEPLPYSKSAQYVQKQGQIAEDSDEDLMSENE